MGRILVRGEAGHAIVTELAPAPGEPVIDKPGKGAFHQTDLEQLLRNARVDTLVVCGVTTEVCVHTTIREANDRGYRCVALADACASYFPEFHRVGLEMIKAQGGIFGWVSDAGAFAGALSARRAA
jgi:biuret amidohydrolase